MGVRPRVQRAFLAWFEEAGPRFGRRVILGRRTDRVILFKFDVGQSILYGWLGRHELTVSVEDTEESWDLLISLDVVEVRRQGGIVCRLCDPEGRRVFPTREALWRDHLFEPFLAWVNEKLVPATAIAVYGEKGHSTWAKLVCDGDDVSRATKVVPLIPP